MIIGRESLIKKLNDLIFENENEKMNIIPIEGPGGIGKTTLLDHAISITELTNKKFLKLSLDGRTPGKCILSKLKNVAENAIANQLPNNGQPYFSNTKKLFELKSEIDASILENLTRGTISEEKKKFITSLLDVGAHLMKLTPDFYGLSLPKDISTDDIEEVIEKVNKCTNELRESGLVDQFMRLVSSDARLKEKLLHNFEETVADFFYLDIVSILKGWKKTEINKFWYTVAEKNKDFEHLLLLIDDFESYQNNIGISFFFEKLLPILESRSPFKTVLLLSTRDEISADYKWVHKYGSMLENNRIPVRTLSKEEAMEIVEQKKLVDINIDELYNETEGIPLLIDLYLKEKQMGGTSAHYLKQFYDRQTQWMEPQQKEWLNKVCYLSEVNLDTIPTVLTDDPKKILDWFQNEGSVRDTRAPVFQVRHFIQKRILEYLKLVSPKEFEEISKKAS